MTIFRGWNLEVINLLKPLGCKPKSMKILHTADWHLGKKLEHLPRMPEQREVLAEIITLADKHEVDAVLIAGDIFDTYNPPAEAVELYFQTIETLAKKGQRPVIVIAGNHDAPDRIEAPDPLARACGILCSGYLKTIIPPFNVGDQMRITQSGPGFVEIQLAKYHYPLRVLLAPYTNEYRLQEFLGTVDEEQTMRKRLNQFWQTSLTHFENKPAIHVLVGHLFMVDHPKAHYEEPDDEKPILHVGGAQALFPEQIPTGIDYVALGHLHRPHTLKNSACPIVYAGSPISYSFSEAKQEKSVRLVTIAPGKPAKVEKLPLHSGRKLSRGTFTSVQEAISWLGDHQQDIVELTMQTDHFLTPQEKKQLYDLNPDLFIVPMPTHLAEEGKTKKQIDLTQRMESLFVDYFKFKNQDQAPSEEIMAIFKELLGNESDA